MKERLKTVDLIRAVSVLGIISYHFSCSLTDINSGAIKPFYQFSNGSWGDIFVTLFFILSGMMLFYNEPNLQNKTGKYFCKRFISIFPMFYFTFLIMYLKNALKYGSFFYKGNPITLVLSFFGMDGYFNYRIDDYYILGEWFLGAIIMLYILYPVLLKLFKKYLILSSIIITGLYLWMLNADVFMISSWRNLISCLVSFWVGMLFAYYKQTLYNKKIIIFSLIISLIILLEKIPINQNILTHIVSIAIFIVLYFVGNYLMEIKILSKFFTFVSKISYPIYLLQHIIIIFGVNHMKKYYTGNIVVVISLILIYIIIFICAYIVYSINKKVMNSKILTNCNNKLK